MDLILSQNINSELIPNACSTLYVLICCYQVSPTCPSEALVQLHPPPLFNGRYPLLPHNLRYRTPIYPN